MHLKVGLEPIICVEALACTVVCQKEQKRTLNTEQHHPKP